MSKPQIDSVPSVAIIGAGISGLVAARTLADQGGNMRFLLNHLVNIASTMNLRASAHVAIGLAVQESRKLS